MRRGACEAEKNFVGFLNRMTSVGKVVTFETCVGNELEPRGAKAVGKAPGPHYIILLYMPRHDAVQFNITASGLVTARSTFHLHTLPLSRCLQMPYRQMPTDAPVESPSRAAAVTVRRSLQTLPRHCERSLP